jgi:hypothetical protein
MKTLSQYSNDHLQLAQPSIWKRVYELRTPDAVLLTMTFPKLFSSLAIVEGFGEVWEFKKPGIWRSDLDIKKRNNHLPFAKFIAQKWGRSGTFELPNGERFEYVFTVLKSTNELFSQKKIRLVSLERESWWKSSLQVIIEDHPDQLELLDKHPWIIMVMYNQILQRRQSAAAH